MLKCKNDSNRTYKGTESSPKGLGYCAHALKIKTVKRGKDGNLWIVKKMSSGIKRWILDKSNDDKLIEEFNKLLKKNIIDTRKDINTFNKLIAKLD